MQDSGAQEPQVSVCVEVAEEFELILGFNVQARSPGSMVRFDVQERELKHGKANTPAQCPGSMH